MEAMQTNAAQTAVVDPVLQRLYEVTERIRRRAAADARARALRAARRRRGVPALGQSQLPLRMGPTQGHRAVPEWHRRGGSGDEGGPAQSPLALRSVSQE